VLSGIFKLVKNVLKRHGKGWLDAGFSIPQIIGKAFDLVTAQQAASQVVRCGYHN
jgi:hypothetical protein